MSRVRHDLVTRIWRGRDPFLELLPNQREAGTGITSQDNSFFASTIEATHPGIVVDVGAGEGGSTIAFARELRDRRMNAVVVAIDTFLGDATDWSNDESFERLDYESGRSSLYPRFVGNILCAGLGNFVLPLTLDATTAAALFSRLGIAANVVHLDAGNEAASIRSYLEAWWPLLVSGGVLIGGPCGDTDQTARREYQSFFETLSVEPVYKGGKVRVLKPGGAAAPMASEPATSVPTGAETPASEPQPDGEGTEESRKVVGSFRLGGRPVGRPETR